MNAECVDILALGGLDLAALEEPKCALYRWACAGAQDNAGHMLDGSLYCANKCALPPEGCERPANYGKMGSRNVYLFCHWAWLNTDVREMLEREAHPAEVAHVGR